MTRCTAPCISHIPLSHIPISHIPISDLGLQSIE